MHLENHAVTQGLAPHKDRVYSLTYDNGRVIAEHEGMTADLDARVYSRILMLPGSVD